jgi:putative NADH-flavin reductase
MPRAAYTSSADKRTQAGGNAGRFMAEALLKTGRHTVTAITRPDSQSSLPQGVEVKKVDYNDPATIVDALRGQEALVITISGHAPIQEIEEKLVRAAAEAGVPWM